jgi:hypothetical protein
VLGAAYNRDKYSFYLNTFFTRKFVQSKIIWMEEEAGGMKSEVRKIHSN